MSKTNETPSMIVADHQVFMAEKLGQTLGCRVHTSDTDSFFVKAEDLIRTYLEAKQEKIKCRTGSYYLKRDKKERASLEITEIFKEGVNNVLKEVSGETQ